MRWSDIPFDASERMLRQFAALCAVALAFVAAWQGYTRGWPGWVWAVAAAGLAVAVVGWLRPGWLRPVFIGWMVLAFPIGWLVSQTLLVVLFFGLFLPVALIFRMMGRDAVMLRKKSQESYWQTKPAANDVRRYFRQY